MQFWHGPGRAFDLLIDQEDRQGVAPPAEVERIYAGWRLPAFEGRPYVFANFVISRDGRISFAVPGAAGGGAVSGNNRHDQWLMGLLRARADAVLVGDNTLRTEPEHIWTAESIFPEDAEAFAALRRSEGRRQTPLTIFASSAGNIHAEARVFSRPDSRILIATTDRGAEQARTLLGHRPNVDYLALGEDAVDMALLMHTLHQRHDVRSLLCEGGPTLYGSLLQAEQIDDEFLTLSPCLVGNPRGGPARPGLVEGVGFMPGDGPCSRLVSVHRADDFLFLHSRYR